MTAIGDTLNINLRSVRNRILMPALLCFNWADEEGYQTVDRAVHYGKRDPYNKDCNSLTVKDIEIIKETFIKAANRAKRAGLDGVEIHGAHGFLLNQFTSKKSNSRNDEYGVSLENRIKLPVEIVKEIRESIGSDSIISYRFGVNDPSFKEDIFFAKELVSAGVDLLDVSSGICTGEFIPPDDFEFSEITYMGKVIHDNVAIPVASVYGIRSPEQAKILLEKNFTDIVAVGRGILADPDWADKALNGKTVNTCLHCESWCKYGKDGRTCPRRENS